MRNYRPVPCRSGLRRDAPRNMARAAGNIPEYTPECAQAAIELRAYCETNFTIGESTSCRKSVTGESYRELCTTGFLTLAGALEQAKLHFDEYARNRSGTLYWRIVPEFAYIQRPNTYGYYMRLLISVKPRKD